MLWRVRTTLSDRPGSLAALTRHCGEQEVNILGLQIFPGVGGVTDELVLRAPDAWGMTDIAQLVEVAGGRRVSVSRCTEHSLVDSPIDYLHALRQLAQDPAALPTLLARLLDATCTVAGETSRTDPLSAVQDTMQVEVGERRVELRRTPSFTGTEHARAVAFAEVARLVLAGRPEESAGSGRSTGPGAAGRLVLRLAAQEDITALGRMHRRCSADTLHHRYGTPLSHLDDQRVRTLLLAGGGGLVAAVDDEIVGAASLGTLADDRIELSLVVEDGWQRQGVGSRLLISAARLARGRGAREVVLQSPEHNPALMSLAFTSGLRARIRQLGAGVVVTVGVEGLKPLAMVATGDGTAPAAP